MKQIFVIGLFLFVSSEKTFGQNNYTDSLKDELTVAKSDSLKVWLLWNLSNTYLFAFADTSTTYLLQGMQLSGKINDKTHQGGFMNLLCVALANQGNFIGALDIGLKALTLAENANDTLLIIYANNALMHCYRQQGDYKEALRYGNRAVSFITRPPKDSTQASTVYGVISSVYERNNQLDSALYFGEWSYNLNHDFSEIYPILGDVYSRLERLDTALHYYRMGIPICIKNYSNIGLVKIYNGMSKIFETFGQMDSAIYYARKSIFQEGIHSYPEGVLYASVQLASLYESKKAPDSIIKYLKLGNAIRDSLFSRKKIREAQNYEYNATMDLQNAEIQKQEAANKIRTYALLSIISVFLIIGVFLWRNNLQKQKVNTLLQEQKQEIQRTLTELKSTQSQLIESEKMASLGELTTGIAHEIQNPLNFVNNFSEVNTELIDELKQELSSGNHQGAVSIADDIRENQLKISHHGKRAEVIVKSMLQHSRTSTGQKELTDINQLTDEYMRLSYQGFRSRDKSFQVKMKTDFDASADEINIVPQDIGRVLMNLFNNAFYAVKEKKQRLENSAPPGGNAYEPTVIVKTRKIRDRIELIVKDNGDGIPQKLVSKIFQPFFTTKPTGKGTGLGLSLSYDIVKAHQGEIRVETKEGEGTSFISLLPIT